MCRRPSTYVVQRLSDNQKFILKLADRRLGHRGHEVEIPWTSSLEDRLRHAVSDIQMGTIPDWIELLRDNENPKRPDEEDWEDWAWEIATWYWKLSNYDTELSAYRLLHRLQGRYIPRLLGVICLHITSDPTPLHPVTDIVQGLALEYIPGVCMEKLKPGIDVSEQEAERISSQVMEGFRAIEAENCVLHNDIHLRNIVLQEKDRSAVIIDFGQAIVHAPGRSDESWMGAIYGAADTHFMRRILRDPEHGGWKKTVMPFEMSNWRYEEPLEFNEYVESLPEDFHRATFARVLDTDWEGARDNVYMWRIRPGVRCRPKHDFN
ncbi:hypothetical protein EDD18DRAFT_562232 [Armillaria luteobubalina]|uniref:Protein kinase domain-containing protein n=1 Tax=Armillaria luteobubalina TaxID=153913 RepID=A0AA39PT23_9AGAR|nr:hypothetical protein EDD18DRAFT_562232 [Armillaria luteobubalina]